MKHAKRLVVILIFLAIIGCLGEGKKLHTIRSIDRVSDYLLERSYISEEEQIYFKDTAKMLEEGKDSKFVREKEKEFLELFYKIYDSSQPLQEMDMIFLEDRIIFQIPMGTNPIESTLCIAYEATVDGDITKTASFHVDYYFYTVRNNWNDHIVYFLGRDSLFNYYEVKTNE